MSGPANARLAELGVLVGTWELTASIGDRVLSTARSTFAWLDDRPFLGQRTDPPTHLVPEWEGLAPQWVDMVIGLDDHSGGFTALYGDSRGVCRTYRMTFADGRWTLASRPGPDFHQRFHGELAADGSAIDGVWEASADGQAWTTDFAVAYRRAPRLGDRRR